MKKCWILYLIIFFIISLIGIYFTIFPNLEPDSNIYEFDIMNIEENSSAGNQANDQNSYIQNHLLNYDFKKNEGQWSFDFWTSNKTTLRVELPNQLIIKNYSAFDKENNKPFGCITCYQTSAICSFNNSLENPVSIILNISSPNKTFVPNGLFFFGQSIKRITLFSNIKYDEREVLLHFNFGKKYKCDENCFFKEIGNEGLSYSLVGEDFRIYLLPGSKKEELGFTRFRLNTYNYSKQIWNGVLLAFFISLLAGIIVVFLENLNSLTECIKKQLKIIIKKIS